MTDEEFGMGYLDIKPAPAPATKLLSSNATTVQNGTGNLSQIEQIGGRAVSAGSVQLDSGNSAKDLRKPDGKNERTE